MRVAPTLINLVKIVPLDPGQEHPIISPVHHDTGVSWCAQAAIVGRGGRDGVNQGWCLFFEDSGEEQGAGGVKLRHDRLKKRGEFRAQHVGDDYLKTLGDFVGPKGSDAERVAADGEIEAETDAIVVAVVVCHGDGGRINFNRVHVSGS